MVNFVYESLQSTEYIRLLRLWRDNTAAGAKDDNDHTSAQTSCSNGDSNDQPEPTSASLGESSFKPLRTGTLCLDIISARLDETPKYECVSYAWVTKHRTQKLATTQGTDVLVTDSLLEALPYLINASSTKYLWIDQVCINQDDLAERSQRVSTMGNIYKKAERLLVWLGPKSMDACMLLQVLERVPRRQTL